MSYLATDSLFSKWKVWTQFLDESTEGLGLDGLEESHPIEVLHLYMPSFCWFNLQWDVTKFIIIFVLFKLYFQVEINHASKIDEIFDAISYIKGAYVIWILQSYLSTKPFQVGCSICVCVGVFFYFYFLVSYNVWHYYLMLHELAWIF